MIDSIVNFFRRPQAANHFSIKFIDGDWKAAEWVNIFSKQVTRVEVNLLDNIVRVWVRQSVSGHIVDLLLHIMKKENKKIDKCIVEPIHNNTYRYVFEDGELVDHNVAFDYDDRTPVLHYLEFKFKETSHRSNRDIDN